MKNKCAENDNSLLKPKCPKANTSSRLAEDIQASDYDLVIMGALGMGAVKDSLLGGVVERVVRRIQTDTPCCPKYKRDARTEGAYSRGNRWQPRIIRWIEDRNTDRQGI